MTGGGGALWQAASAMTEPVVTATAQRRRDSFM
jgi:hypothetical protein